jgi:hypothetical protein
MVGGVHVGISLCLQFIDFFFLLLCYVGVSFLSFIFLVGQIV